MSTTQKARSLSEYIAEELKLRFAGSTLLTGGFSQTDDTDGNPLILMGSGSPGAKNAVIKVMPTAWPLAKDSLGNAAIQYTPHTILLATEKNAEAGDADNDDIFTAQDLLHLLGTLMYKGCKVEWYQEDDGTQPTASTFTANKLSGSWEHSLKYPLTISS